MELAQTGEFFLHMSVIGRYANVMLKCIKLRYRACVLRPVDFAIYSISGYRFLSSSVCSCVWILHPYQDCRIVGAMHTWSIIPGHKILCGVSEG